jgi:hypothetical protein
MDWHPSTKLQNFTPEKGILEKSINSNINIISARRAPPAILLTTKHMM